MSTTPARAALAAVAILVLTGCGAKPVIDKSTDEPPKPDRATSDCREQWRDLAEKTKAAADRTNPSALPDRWNSVVATIDYYATSATKDDCGDRLKGQQSANAALTAFEVKLRPYDVPYRYAQVKSAAQQYAARPVPKKPKKGNRAKRPTPAAVAAATKVLDSQATTATQQQGPAWEQARVVDLGNAAAVAKAVKDLAFLSSQSAAYRACSTALGTIDAAVKPTR